MTSNHAFATQVFENEAKIGESDTKLNIQSEEHTVSSQNRVSYIAPYLFGERPF